MDLQTTIRSIFEVKPYGKEHAITASDLKEKCKEETGHYPNPREFKEAMDSLRMGENTLGIITGPDGYFRAKEGSPDMLKFKNSKKKSSKRITNLINAI